MRQREPRPTFPCYPDGRRAEGDPAGHRHEHARPHDLLDGPRHRPPPRRAGRDERGRRLHRRRYAPAPRPPPPRDRQGRPGGGCVPAGPAGGQAEAVLAVEARSRRRPIPCRSPLQQPVPPTHLEAPCPVRVEDVAEEGWVRPAVPVSLHTASCGLRDHADMEESKDGGVLVSWEFAHFPTGMTSGWSSPNWPSSREGRRHAGNVFCQAVGGAAAPPELPRGVP